ncbi:Imidazolonepropionase [Altererythrobacter xiamenensis]|uniref:Imidazolonepropionase n=1 Tax=Altererythrobacter xiamenensis TaxID=1316679 RepID=A0A1Y6F833_9SPHN|nr:amidohydrolase family protein [Altererythrobacter xiamenensis]SMQ68872.1 Imidazolonepropionase [Altererythrobacter xiamenensis]
MKRALKLAVSAFALMAVPAAAQNVAITNATVATGDGSEPIEGATVVVRGGKVVAAGTGVTVPAGMQTIDGSGLWVTPGLVAAVTDLGLWDVGAVSESNDISASDARFSAALDVAPAINPESQHIKLGRANGITRAAVTGNPSGAIFSGQGAVIDLGADGDAITRARAFQSVTLSERGARIAGGSRTASHAELRNALREASDFAAGRWSGEDNLLTRADAEALAPVVAGEQKLFVHAHRTSDLRAVLGLTREFPRLDIVLVGATEGWRVAEEIAAAGVPVIAESLQDLPDRFEQLAATQNNIGRMRAAGVNVSVDASTIENVHHLTQHAGNLVALSRVPRATGLSWGEALASITSRPAEAIGMGGRIGVLKSGAAGDLVLWNGDPLELSSTPVRVFIDGIEQPLDSHQSRLRERYRDLDEGDLPKAYDW